MRVFELNKDQLTQLKQRHFYEKNPDTSYLDLACIDDIISNETIIDYYYDVDFAKEDFS